MKAVMPEVPQRLLEERARTGADRWDEMWEGVLHMPPAPNREHQDLTVALVGWLKAQWATPGGNRVHIQVNLTRPGGWPNDYRIPDLVLLTPDRFGIDRNEFFEGAPNGLCRLLPGAEEWSDVVRVIDAADVGPVRLRADTREQRLTCRRA